MLAMQCMRLRHLRLHLHHYGYLISSWIPEEMQLCKEISDLEAVEFENASASKLKKNRFRFQISFEKKIAFASAFKI